MMSIVYAALYTTAFCTAVYSAAAAATFQLVHWNDVHARTTAAAGRALQLCSDLTDEACYGGHPRLATVCKEAKASGVPTLCIDAGDEFLGTVWDSLFKGKQNMDTLPAIGVDIMAVGNHEFDYGVAALAELVDGVDFPIVGGCNMDFSQEPSLSGIKKWHVFDMAGTKVGILGYIAADTSELSSTGNVRFSNPLTAVPQCIADFKAENPDVNVIGLLSHAGLIVDEALAQEVAGDVDFIVGGHSHTPMFLNKMGPCLEFDTATSSCTNKEESAVEYPHIVNDIPVLQMFYGSKYAGQVVFDEAGKLTDDAPIVHALGVSYLDDGTKIKIDDDEDLVALLAERAIQVQEFGSTTVGSTPVELTADRPDIRIKEMPLGNLICDSMLWAVTENGYEMGDKPLVCVVNGGGIRASIDAGDITVAEVNTVLPFGNVINILEVDGATLRSALENGYSQVDPADPAGRFAHIGGGLSVVFDSSKAAYVADSETGVVTSSGERVVELAVDCQAVTDEQVFHVVTNDFMAGGGDGYAMFKDATRVLEYGPDLAQGLADYIVDVVVDNELPVESIDVEGRIVSDASTQMSLCDVPVSPPPPAQAPPAQAPTAQAPPAQVPPTDPASPPSTPNQEMNPPPSSARALSTALAGVTGLALFTCLLI